MSDEAALSSALAVEIGSCLVPRHGLSGEQDFCPALISDAMGLVIQFHLLYRVRDGLDNERVGRLKADEM